jgi:hypothetical protein
MISKKTLLPEENLKNFLETLNTNKVHNNFKNIYDSLDMNNDIHVTIKGIVMNYVVMDDITVNECLSMIMADIYNNNFSDFAINFPNNKSLKCLKIILRTIPYFDMIFQEFDMKESIDLDTDYNLTILLVKSLYVPIINEIKIHNFTDLCLLMDKYLMKDNFNEMLVFAKNNIKDIIKYLLNSKQFDSILNLYNVLNSTQNSILLDNPDGLLAIKNLKEIIGDIFKVDFGETMFIFKNWSDLFEDETKIQTIQLLGKYELLNESKINPVKVLSLLINLNFSNAIYNHIYNKIKYENAIVEYCLINITKYTVGVTTINIHSYYPVFKYKIITHVPVGIIEIMDQTKEHGIIIAYKNHSPLNIQKGTNLMFCIDKGSKQRTKIYTINKIVKCNKNKEMEVSYIQYIDPSIDDIKYKIFFNIPFIDDIKNGMYINEGFEYKVAEYKIDLS